MMDKRGVLADCGTSYAKLQFTADGERTVLPAREFLQRLDEFEVAASTGHNPPACGRTYNELIALAEGALAVVDDGDFTVLDCGARDVKYVRIESRRVTGMDWNTECGAFAGQMIELLTRHFEIDPNAKLESESGERMPVVCGVLGMTAMFDLIAHGVSHEEAFSRFLRGIAFNCESLVGKPERIFLSGGLCENALFVGSFGCEVVPLGRFLLLDGLKRLVSGA